MADEKWVEAAQPFTATEEKVLQNFVYLLIDYLFVFSVLSEQTTYPWLVISEH